MNPRISFSPVGSSNFEKLMGHHPEVLGKWAELERTLFQSTPFDQDLLEQVRRTLAFGNQCEYCMAKAGPPRDKQAALKTSTAVMLAQLMVQDHTRITDREFDIVREVFSDAEIAYLCAFISFITASQIFGATLNLGPNAVADTEA